MPLSNRMFRRKWLTQVLWFHAISFSLFFSGDRDQKSRSHTSVVPLLFSFQCNQMANVFILSYNQHFIYLLVHSNESHVILKSQLILKIFSFNLQATKFYWVLFWEWFITGIWSSYWIWLSIWVWFWLTVGFAGISVLFNLTNLKQQSGNRYDKSGWFLYPWGISTVPQLKYKFELFFLLYMKRKGTKIYLIVNCQIFKWIWHIQILMNLAIHAFCMICLIY